ncbi:rhombosortase [Sphaerotilus montanus]|uniref:Rhomboid family GlyGly-CTERM serine protease n=1 Tax=Sphaerotilus montanus TaxID=522889 RepID=A0A7Y9QY84_9BURK|nr:rhombosortase [Sphaerotilus montanus]NYG31973.1 rhomboid family GlyGly-CTERM serine protease [Sphaerotilus montanus]NZD56509.1 rhombosortase [Sphaerotilus montanus]
MARRVRLMLCRHHAWLGVGLLLVVPSLLIALRPGLARMALAWVPALVWSEPWRWWSAAWVHLSTRHLLANLAGAALLLLLGWVARLPREAAWAWALAWPLTHLGLLLAPDLLRYGGLSGVLHAGVAVAAVALVRDAALRRDRVLGALLLAGLCAKVLGERAWAHTLVTPPGWDIAVAPLAHASGTVCGALAALLLVRSRPWSPAPPPGSSAG